MPRQVEAETVQWQVKRKAARIKLTLAVMSGEFAAVPAQPFAGENAGTNGYPVTDEMEAKLIAAYDGQPTLNANDQMGLMLQVNTMESFRRAQLAQKQSRRELLKHLAFKLGEAGKFEDVMLQNMAGNAKTFGLTA